MIDRDPQSASSSSIRINWALLLLRLILAAVFGAYGYAKWAREMDRFVGLLMTVQIPLPALTARLVAALELGGAGLLVVGIGTRLIGLLLAFEMAVAIATVVWPQGFRGGYAFELTLLTVSLALVVAGGGAFSISRLWGRPPSAGSRN